MRTTLFAALVILGLSSATSAQVLQIDMTDGQFRAGMRPVDTPYATGGPWAALPAKGVRTDVTPTVTDFRIRSWIEGDGVRVIVFAVTRSDPSKLAFPELPRPDEREEQVASLHVAVGQSVDVVGTDKYNARRITLTASTIDIATLVERARFLRAATLTR